MKEFRIAQIVPVDQLEDTKDNQYHMCLAHLVGQGGQKEKYTEFYSKQSMDYNKFVLMDNGAAEGSQLDADKLIEAYKIIKPREMVLPDTLYDGRETLDKSINFMNRFRKLPCRFMGVPQGRTMDEWIDCADHMLNWDRINTIGISKFLNIVTGDPMARYRAMQALTRLAYQKNCDIEVHLLGCDEGPKIVGEIAMMFPMVRGCDSAFTYIHTKQNNKKITHATTRPRDGEIDFLNDPAIEEFPIRAREFEHVCGVIDNGVSKTWREKRSE